MSSPYDPNAGGQVPPPPGGYPGQAPPPAGYPGQAPPPPAGYPGPAYPNSPGAQQYTPQRPGMLTAASVLAFILSGWNIIGGIILMAGGAVVNEAGDQLGSDDVQSTGGLIILGGILFIVIGGCYIWGGVTSLNGKNTQVLTIVAGVDLLVSIVWIIINQGLITLVSIAVAAIILTMVLVTPSRQFVRAKGGKTF